MNSGMIALVIFGTLIVLFMMKVPIAYALILSSIPAMIMSGIPLDFVPKRLFTACDSFSFMAVPFFILAGTLMSQGGISERLIAFANSLIGRFSGGLGLVSIAACMFFAAISGSSAATTAAIGGIMIPEMVKRKYDKDFAAAINAAGGTIGVIIPPSIPFVTYGILTGASISTLFIAGFGPGLLMGLALMVVVYFISKKNGYREDNRAGLGEIWRSFKSAILAILMPVIVLGGIYSGKFTPTEAAVVAVVYGLVVGAFVYRNISFKSLIQILKDSSVSTAQVLLLICAANLFGYVLTYNRIPDMVAKFILGISTNKWVILLLIDIVLLIVGTFMDTVAALIILVPIFFPIIEQVGVNPVHFGMIICVTLAVGMITPPFGCCLFVACGVADINLEAITKKVIPFIVALVVVVLLVTFFEPISTALPAMLNMRL
ncbi:MAG: TRAP transporter large permease [Candidatus Heteroscillospira sp.]